MDSSNPDPSGAPALSPFRSQRERDLERKRARGEASCAECRRLKLKCDKKVPCSSCLRRGCATICPNGSLTTGQGSRYVLANTDKLHSKVLEMSKRIRQLEDALQISQLSVSSTPHPLLSQDLLAIKTGVDVVAEKDRNAADAEILPNIGTLTISEHGEARFVGRTGAEAIMEAVVRDVSLDARNRALATLPTELAYLTETFPFSPLFLPRPLIVEQLLARLPTYERATALVEAYLEHLSCFFRPVERGQITEELLPRYYKHREDAKSEDENGVAVHQLALLFAVFAAGSAGDLTQEAHNEEGELFRHCSRSALALHSIFDGTSLATVQALSLVGAYDFFSASAHTLESAWKSQSLALCLASSIGLHWDPSSWGIPEYYAQRRRHVFWELYALDNWKSLGSGRPPIFRSHEVDCRFPEDHEQKVGEDGSIVHGFWYWKHDYAKQVVAAVAAKLCTVRPLKYSEVLELDRKVREYNGFPPELVDSTDTINHHYQSFMVSLYREISLIFIHRNFFARALRENPSNPIRSRFGPSFLAAYASAITILRSMRRSFDTSHGVVLRMWPLWAHALASGVIIGSVAARDTSELARTALKDLELAIGLFERASAHPVSKNGLPILLRLRDKARSNFGTDDPLTTATTPESTSTSGGSDPVAVKQEPMEEALLLLGGETRFVKKIRKALVNTDARCPSDTPSPSPDTTPETAAAINSQTDTNSMSVQPGTQIEPTLGLESGDVLTWLYGRPIERANTADAYSHNQIAFANALSAASTAGNLGDSCGPMQALQQQQQALNNFNADNFAFWGFQNAFNLQTEQNAAAGTSNSKSQIGGQASSADNIPSLFANANAASNPTSDLFGTDAGALSMLMDDPINYDFEVGSGTAYGDSSVRPQLDTGDATIDDAWRSIMADPRFTSTEANSAFSFTL